VSKEATSASIEASSIAPSAIRGRYLAALSFALFAPLPTLLSEHLALQIGALLVWIVLFWLIDRWRLGPDYKAIQLAEWSYMRQRSRGLHFLAFAWTMVAYLFLDGADDSWPTINMGTAVFLAFAVGAFSQAIWESYKLRARTSS